MRKSGDYLVFPGGGTQFKDGVTHYIEYIQKVSVTVAIRPRVNAFDFVIVLLDLNCGCRLCRLLSGGRI